MRATDSTTAPSSGTAPPQSPVPEPRGTTARPSSPARRTQAATSSVVSGSTTRPHSPSAMEPSRA
jgi:hypothetical protein